MRLQLSLNLAYLWNAVFWNENLIYCLSWHSWYCYHEVLFSFFHNAYFLELWIILFVIAFACSLMNSQTFCKTYVRWYGIPPRAFHGYRPSFYLQTSVVEPMLLGPNCNLSWIQPRMSVLWCINNLVALITSRIANQKKQIMVDFGLFYGHFEQIANLKSKLTCESCYIA